jgi:DNA (cytosine-5)-methyltransferase 1
VDTTQKLPTVLSLCTGYGGIERGLDLAGVEHRVIAHVEIEAFAIANLVAKMEASELDAAPVWSNLKTLPVDCFRDRVDILTGGYPCQPFSAAGKRLGEEDPRHLWPYIKEIIRAVRPVRCFFENVEGHVSLGLREVISDLESLGYTTAWGIFSAREVGAPHQRKRVYIMADSKSELSKRTISERDRNGQSKEALGDRSDSQGANSVADSSDPRSSRTGIESQHSNEIVEPCDSNSKRESGEDVANSDSNQQRPRVRQEQSQRDTAGQCPSNSGSVGIKGVADTDSSRLGQGNKKDAKEPSKQSDGSGFRSGVFSNAFGQRLEGQTRNGKDCDQSRWIREKAKRSTGKSSVRNREPHQWPAEPRLGRVVDGCANRVDRIRLLGNGVVPQCAAKAWAVLSEELLGS